MYSICLVRQIGTNENKRTKTVFGAKNKDYVVGTTFSCKMMPYLKKKKINKKINKYLHCCGGLM